MSGESAENKSSLSFHEVFFGIVAFTTLLLLFIKIIFDGDFTWDSWWYHIPFAARIWSIIPESSFKFDDFLQHRYDGFPLLAEALQGFFWKLSGSVNATSMVCYFSLLAYLLFLRSYCRIPWYFSAIALLAVPVITIHATTALTDLPGNIFASIVVLITFLIWIERISCDRKSLVIFAIAAIFACNMRFQVLPVVSVATGFLVIKLFRSAALSKTKCLLLILIMLVSYATVLKNTFRFGNPFYPVKMEIAGVVLNHGEDPSLPFFYPPIIPDNLTDKPGFVRWIYSLMEVDRPFARGWNSHQVHCDRALGSPGDLVGGYFSVYVIFNLVLFGYLLTRLTNKKIRVATLLLFIGLSVLTGLLPQAMELRYYMYWMILLVSLNLFLLVENDKLKHLIWVFLGFLLIVFMSRDFYIYLTPFSSLGKSVSPCFGKSSVRIREISQDVSRFRDGHTYCLRGYEPLTVFYAPQFHPPRHYSIQQSNMSWRWVICRIRGCNRDKFGLTGIRRELYAGPCTGQDAEPLFHPIPAG